MATSQHSAACCTTPPVAANYDPKGTYDTIGGFKTYSNGSAPKGIIIVYDIFGYRPQTLQGADILARNYRVLMPDWFAGRPAALEWYPPETDQQKKDLGEWFSHWPPTWLVERLPAYVAAARAQFPDTTEWAIVGHCWGGKVAALIGATDLFKVAVACHPAMIDPADAPAVRIPYAMLASQDEDAEDIKAFEAGLKVPHLVDTFQDQIHGWMAARGDLADEQVREAYTRAYKTVEGFLAVHF